MNLWQNIYLVIITDIKFETALKHCDIFKIHRNKVVQILRLNYRLFNGTTISWDVQCQFHMKSTNIQVA